MKHLMLALLALTLTAGTCDVSRTLAITTGGASLVQFSRFVSQDVATIADNIFRDLLDLDIPPRNFPGSGVIISDTGS